jgi:hypothetical protein
MAVKDISDLHVCAAYVERWGSDLGGPALGDLPTFTLSFDGPPPRFVDAILMEATGQPEKVVYRAMERAYNRGYIEYGVSMRSGWLTEKGQAFYRATKKVARY